MLNSVASLIMPLIAGQFLKAAGVMLGIQILLGLIVGAAIFSLAVIFKFMKTVEMPLDSRRSSFQGDTQKAGLNV